MVASLMGGLSLTYSEVGVCHALSYGLSFVFEFRHGVANCIVFNHLEDYYPQGVGEFKDMVGRFNIDLPQNLSSSWNEDEITRMAEVSFRLDHMWHHALGENWKEKISMEAIKDLFRRM